MRGGPLLFPHMRVGILGGSFNPAHEGHLHISLIALKRLRLHRIMWLVSVQNPLKPAWDMASFDARLRGAEEVAKHPQIIVTAIEKNLRTSYTADVLMTLRRRWPGVRFVWLMGADNLAQLPKWRAWNRIMQLAPVAVLDRPGSGIKALSGVAAMRYRKYRLPPEHGPHLARLPAPAWTFIACRRHQSSATAIRAARRGKILQ